MASDMTEHGDYAEAAKMDGGIITAIVGSAALVAGALVTGFWQWLSGRKKNDADAQASVMNGFILLLGEFKNERTALVARITELEANNQRQDRHIAKLERRMIQHRIEIPEDEA